MTNVHLGYARAVAGLAMVVASLACVAQTAAPPQGPTQARPNDVPVGDTTRTLLDIQRSGAQAGPQISLTGEQAAIGYARYMKSFQYALPEFFTSQATGSPLRGGAGSQAMMPGQ